MTAYTVPFDHNGVDAVLGATPLAQLASGGEVPTLLNMFLGAKGGCIGEVSCAALLLGGIYLVARKVIHPITPLIFIGTVFLGSFLLGQEMCIRDSLNPFKTEKKEPPEAGGQK